MDARLTPSEGSELPPIRDDRAGQFRVGWREGVNRDASAQNCQGNQARTPENGQPHVTSWNYGCSIKGMLRKRASPRLTPLQLAVMRVLWSRDEASVADVQHAMSGRRLALTTVATLLVRLEQRGLVGHRVEGRQYVYKTRVSPADVRETATRELLRNLFDGDVTALVSHLLDARTLTREEVADLQRLVRAKTQR